MSLQHRPMSMSYNLDKKFWLLFLPLIFVGFLLHRFLWIHPDDLMMEDIYYIWLEGKRIINGENPYGRVLTGNMRNNDKYATLFPIAYLLSALIQKIGF